MRRKRCSICHNLFTEYGNNAYPVNEGRCCDACNDLVVIPTRIKQLVKSLKKDEVANDQDT